MNLCPLFLILSNYYIICRYKIYTNFKALILHFYPYSLNILLWFIVFFRFFKLIFYIISRILLKTVHENVWWTKPISTICNKLVSITKWIILLIKKDESRYSSKCIRIICRYRFQQLSKFCFSDKNSEYWRITIQHV